MTLERIELIEITVNGTLVVYYCNIVPSIISIQSVLNVHEVVSASDVENILAY